MRVYCALCSALISTVVEDAKALAARFPAGCPHCCNAKGDLATMEKHFARMAAAKSAGKLFVFSDPHNLERALEV